MSFKINKTPDSPAKALLFYIFNFSGVSTILSNYIRQIIPLSREQKEIYLYKYIIFITLMKSTKLDL